MVAIVRCSGARFRWRRLRGLHECQEGGVQSLSLVLTLPIFIMIVMFIVQVSQLMVGIMVVNYSAFAAARAAAVWVPAHSPIDGYDHERENILPPPISADSPVTIQYRGGESTSYKLKQIFAAAAMACAPISPSHNYQWPLNGPTALIPPTANTVYASMVPASQRNARVPARIDNKIKYSFWNTDVFVAFEDKDTVNGPTYNPRVSVLSERTGEYYRSWNRQEVGWQDPLTITVRHNFALLPGPGRFLAKYIVRADGRADEVSPRIANDRAPNGERLYTTPITASATITAEGFKPVLDYEQSRY